MAQAVDDTVERLVRHRFVLVAAAGKNQDVVAPVQLAEKPADQRALADSGGSTHVDRHRASLADTSERVLQDLQLFRSTDEGGLAKRRTL